jgi:Lon protease-like protein
MSAPAETLVNALSMLCPFEPTEKQALLEARGWEERVAILVALLEISGIAPAGPVSVN